MPGATHCSLVWPMTEHAHRTPPLARKSHHVTPLLGCTRLWRLFRTGRGITSKFSLGPWQMVKDEPLDIHPALPFTAGQVVEEHSLLPDPRKGGPTSLLDGGRKQRHVSALIHNGPADQTGMLCDVTSHMHLHLILIRKAKHHAKMLGQVDGVGKHTWQPMNIAVPSAPSSSFPTAMDNHALTSKSRIRGH